MAIRLSDDQQQAVMSKNKNILVSAAAGSGKTFVLTRRVLNRIVVDRWNIDDFLIVTFTNDAAAEMKDRIVKSLEAELKEVLKYENVDIALAEHIEKQLNITSRANISTIDAFCAGVVRQNFNKTNLDLGYRNISVTEESSLKRQAVDEIFGYFIENGDEDFMAFYNMYMNKNNDNDAVNIIYSLYKFVSNEPYPEKWLDTCQQAYENNNYGRSVWSRHIEKEVEKSINIAKKYIQKADKYFIGCDNKPKVIYDAYENLYRMESAFAGGGIRSTAFEEVKFTIKIGKSFDYLGCEIIALIKEYLKFAKTELKNAKELSNIFSTESQYTYEKIRPVVKGLIKAEKEFISRYSELKLEKQLAEFSDISHCALNILRNDDGTVTETAKDYQDKFREIIIDEYQDSNYLQEEILTAVSRCDRGENNIFMVGDVKQAIYKFRLTTPKIFMDKYNRYANSQNDEQRILLSENYRSRDIVLNACNLIFKQIMDTEIGEVDYTEDVALHPKASYPIPDKDINIADSAELILVDTVNVDEGRVECKIDGKTGEANIVAQRIYDMLFVNPLYILDKDTQEYRPVEKKDIVIIIRKRINAGIFIEALNSLGISCVFEQSNPLYETTEVKNIISLLRIIDNPLQDIDMINVLHCPMYGLSYDDIARIRCNNNDMAVYDTLKNTEYKSTAVEKLLDDLAYYREFGTNNSVTELINEIYKRSEYFNYVGMFEKGNIAQANLRLFRERVMTVESYGVSDIHGVLQTIDEEINLDERNKITGAAQNDDVDAIRIKTIHKSKGLEFPVVFVSLLHEEICRAYNDSFIFDRELGIGLKYFDQKNRFKYNTFPFDTILSKHQKDEYSEAMRLLYVALTRAREKLIMTGVISTKAVKSYDNIFNELNDIVADENLLLPYDIRRKASCPLHWILGALKREKFNNEGYIKQMYYNVEDIEAVEEVTAKRTEKFIENLHSIEKRAEDIKVSDTIINTLGYNYPFMTDTILPSKISITEIKRKFSEEINSPNYYNTELKGSGAVSSTGNITGAQLGTVYHSVFENIDFKHFEGVDKYLENISQKGIFTTEEMSAIDRSNISAFVSSELFNRISNADAIYKEIPFVMNIKASSLPEYSDTDANIVVHGIVDLYFKEGNDLIIVDYKTDRIRKSVEELKYKYRVQLALYKEAVEKSTGLKVKECIIYSVEKGESVNV